jgi:NADPH:quinone reductase-like Zn-dependent oxidoreductase
MEYAQLAAGETLLVTGAGGGVGSAAAQIGKWRGARVVGVDRYELPVGSPAAAALDDFFVLGDEPLESVVRRATSSRSAEDAEAICEAVMRPTMRFVEIKTPEQQGSLMLHVTMRRPRGQPGMAATSERTPGHNGALADAG